MPLLKITGVPPFDGDYPINLESFTGHELHTIKAISGVRGGELMDALEAGDYDLLVAFAVIGLQRAGKVVHKDQLLAADIGSIRVEPTEEETEAAAQIPPVSLSPNGNENEHGDSERQSASSEPSGFNSDSVGVPPANGQSLTGLPGSDTFSASVPGTSAT